jgi:glycerol-3-phosphate acyltransferase PlsY
MLLNWLSLLPVVVAAYLIGSIPTGVILARMMGWPDPRTYGSGHIGGLNVSRRAGRGALVVVGLLDLLKGIVGVWIATRLSANPYALPLAGMAVTAGHCWSVWVNFAGGMGLATAFGAVLPYAPIPALIAGIALAVIRFFIIKHSPRAVIAALLTVPISLLIFRSPLPIFLLGTGAAAILILRHTTDWNRVYSSKSIE